MNLLQYFQNMIKWYAILNIFFINFNDVFFLQNAEQKYLTQLMQKLDEFSSGKENPKEVEPKKLHEMMIECSKTISDEKISQKLQQLKTNPSMKTQYLKLCMSLFSISR